MKVQHDWKSFVTELVCFKHGQVSLKDFRQIANPAQRKDKVKDQILNQNSSINLIKENKQPK
jgi:hypothetical protein